MKNILFLAYHFPPVGGAPVQRSLHFVRYLLDEGYRSVVISGPDKSMDRYTPEDQHLVNKIPKNTPVYKVGNREPLRKKGFSRKLQNFLFLPTPFEKWWIPAATELGDQAFKKYNADLIYASMSPFESAVVASSLSQKLGIPWVADLRDPWTEAYWETQMPKTARSKKKNLKFEEDVLNTASQITTVGKGIQKLIQKKTTQPVSVIYNGYRDHNNEFLTSEYFEIVHLGNLGSMQSCHELIEAVTLLPKAKKDKLRLVFIGTLADEYKATLDIIPDINVEYVDFLPYSEMMFRARSASMLFLPRLNSSYSKSLISAKLFDYLALRRPILAIADKGSDIEDILQHTGNGQSFLPEEIKAISAYISSIMNTKISQFDTLLPEKEEQKLYSSRNNVHRLVKVFENLSI